VADLPLPRQGLLRAHTGRSNAPIDLVLREAVRATMRLGAAAFGDSTEHPFDWVCQRSDPWRAHLPAELQENITKGIAIHFPLPHHRR
jgi:hypothetical protein